MMKKFSKYIIKSIILGIIFILVAMSFCYVEYYSYTKNYNKKIYGIVNLIENKYPEVGEEEIVEILNNTEVTNSNNYLDKYGIYLEKDSIILENKNLLKYFIMIWIMIIGLMVGFLLGLYIKHNKRKDKSIEEIQNSIEKVNKGDYQLDIDEMAEDELSILKNDVYKTMIMLKESNDNSLKDKLSLKKSLEDISHQLKTPLTSIIIALDNLTDNPNMEEENRNYFMKVIRKNTNNIIFLIQAILKLSRLDTDTIEFIKEEVDVDEMVEESISKTQGLCDLKNVKINVNSKSKLKLICDKYWQIEAITNILKNAIEHADDRVDINIKDNDVYLEIAIINNGEGISNKDLPHIFERFYRGENAKKDSVGIGLSLAKAIINKSNGSIVVDSKDNRTEFKIRYLKVYKE